MISFTFFMRATCLFFVYRMLLTLDRYIYEVRRSLRKTAFSFSFRKQIFLQISFASSFALFHTHIFLGCNSIEVFIRVHLPFTYKYERDVCTWPIVQVPGVTKIHPESNRLCVSIWIHGKFIFPCFRNCNAYKYILL